MIQNVADCVCCHCREHLRERSKGSEPSGSGRHGGEGFDEDVRIPLIKAKLSFFQERNLTGLRTV